MAMKTACVMNPGLSPSSEGFSLRDDADAQRANSTHSNRYLQIINRWVMLIFRMLGATIFTKTNATNFVNEGTFRTFRFLCSRKMP